MKNIKLKFLKTLSLLLASLFIINPFGTSPQMLEDKAQIDNSSASSKIIDENNKLISSEGISGHDDRFTFQKVVENYTNMLITSGVVVISGLGLLINYAVTNAQHTINPKKLIDQYINDPLPSLPADMWFARLGGTQDNIYDYMSIKYSLSPYVGDYNEFLNTCNNPNRQTTCEFNDMYEQIAKDVPRTSFGGKSFQLNTSTFHNGVDDACIDQFRRILFIYYMYLAPENKKHDFKQGEADILAMIYYKFLGSWKNSPQGLADDDEAKVCHVFSQLMLVKNKFDIAYKNDDENRFLKSYVNTFSSNLSSEEDRMQWFRLTSPLAEECREYSPKLLLFTPVQTLGVRLFKNDEAMRMWDHIIIDNSMFSGGYLNYDKVFSTIVNLTLSFLLEKSKPIKDLDFQQVMTSLLRFNSQS